MRFALVLTTALVMLAPAGFAQAESRYDTFRADGTLRYRFYTGAEFLVIERGSSDNTDVSYNIRCCTTPLTSDALGTDDVINDDWEFGGRAYLGFRIDERSAVEAVFMGWGHSESETAAAPTFETLNAFEFPTASAFPDGAFDAAAVHDLEFDSTFYSGELSYRHAFEVDGADYRFNLLAGMRAIRLEENMGLESWDSVGFGTPPPSFLQGSYDIATRNTMIGGQVGIETFVPLVDDRLDLDLYFAAGGYANQANVYVDYDEGNTGTSIRQSRIEWDPAGVLEAAATFKVRLWRGVQLNLGYRAVYLIGVAAASDQFAQSGAASDFFGNSFDNDSKVLFHGPSIGLGLDF